MRVVAVSVIPLIPPPAHSSLAGIDNAVLFAILVIWLAPTPRVVATKDSTIDPLEDSFLTLIVQANPESVSAVDGVLKRDQEVVGSRISGHGKGAAIYTAKHDRQVELNVDVERLVAGPTPLSKSFKTRC